MPDTGPTKTLAEWLAFEENPVVCDEEAFRLKYGAHADQYMDRATVDKLVEGLVEAPPPEDPPAE